MSRYPSEGVARFDQQFAETEGERNARLRGKLHERSAAEILQRVLAAYGSQGCPIGDSDLDDEQPMRLDVSLTLGDVRRARRIVQAAGMRPADFAVPK